MWTNYDNNSDGDNQMGSTIKRQSTAKPKTFGYEWRTHVAYGYVEGLGREVEPETDLLPSVVEELRADPALLQYRREDWDEDQWRSAGGPDRRWDRHWLTQEQVARLPRGAGIVEFCDRPYKEPLDFIAGAPDKGEFFENAVRAGAMPLFEGIELGLNAIRIFTTDLFKEPRPDLHMHEVDGPEQAERWWDYCAHLIALLQDMQADYKAVLAEAVSSGAGPDEEEASS